MPKVIVINTCLDCPNIKRGWGNADPAYVPTCDKARGDTDILPHTVKIIRNSRVAHYIDIIPDWCPLQDLSEVCDG